MAATDTLPAMAAGRGFENLGLSIIGIGKQYPPYSLSSHALEEVAKRHYPDSAAMSKVLSVNRFTGIDTRSSVGEPHHEMVNGEKAPTVKQLHDIFMDLGVPLAVSAAQKAIAEARIDLKQITHVVSTTCTDSANPGYDHFVCKQLGIKHPVEKILLHGVGCSGGLATLRTAANLALGHSFRRKPARILCVALEVSTTLVRSELDSINEKQEVRIGPALFSDCASAVVLSNGIGEGAEPVYELLGWEHQVVPDTEEDLGFDVDVSGWKVILTPRVPSLTQSVLQPTYTDLLASIPTLPAMYSSPAAFDWAMHPGGATILTGAEKALGITPEHMRASYTTYMSHGNSSSATIFSVLDSLRTKEMDLLAPGQQPKDYIIGCAFGPGITVEACMLKRNFGPSAISGLQTPPETASEASSRSEAGEEASQTESSTARTAIETQEAIETTSKQHAHDGGNTIQDHQQFISEALEKVDLD